MIERALTNEEIAELVSKAVYLPGQSKTEFAIQLFVETMVCPPDCDSYSDEDMKEFILKKLNDGT